MQILELPERDLKRELKKYVLEYVKNNPFFKAKKITRDFILLYLKIPINSTEYKNLDIKLHCSLNQFIDKLKRESIIIPYNTQSYKINKGMKDFDVKLETMMNYINKEKLLCRNKEIKPSPKKKYPKITDDEIEKLHNNKPVVSNIFTRCCKTTVYNRFKKLGVKNYGLNEYEDEDEFIRFLNREYVKDS